MSRLFTVKDKVVLVTGGNMNIGRAVSLGFAEDGAKVVVGDLRREDGAVVIEQLEAIGADYLWTPLDVSDKSSVDKAFLVLMEKYGRIDVLFNNAGVRVNQTGLEHGEEEWDWLFDVNVKGSMLCAQAAAKIMKDQGGGRIINTSSISAYRGQQMRTSYCASKAAINGFTVAAAVEWAPYGIFVNALGWGGVDVDRTPREKMSDGQLKTLAMTPLGMFADKDMLYGPVAFLSMEASSGITGQVILVDGGWSVQGKPSF